VKRIYLSLGSNIGDRLGSLQTAVDKLHRVDLQVTRVSSVYQTAPVEMLNQPDFLNIVVEAQTSLFPMRLLNRALAIERDMGRKRVVAKGPRVIDIDILLHGVSVVRTSRLQIPHPRMQKRRFVLEPLAELAGELRHPVTGQTIRELLMNAPPQGVRRTPLWIRRPEPDERP
jgi:2-amino-4-hydroxy-6-hydroxymethyldihydropteridine diphosphokinase